MSNEEDISVSTPSEETNQPPVEDAAKAAPTRKKTATRKTAKKARAVVNLHRLRQRRRMLQLQTQRQHPAPSVLRMKT